MRLIDADALLMNVVAISNSKGQVTWSAVPTMDILTAPTVDAVEVVRCMDCQYFDNDFLWCDRKNVRMEENCFCSYGERKDNG